MNRPRCTTGRIARALPALPLVLAAGAWAADPVDQVVEEGVARQQAAVTAQRQVDRLADETEELTARYRELLKVIDGLEVYNRLLGRQVEGQARERSELEASIEQVSVMERQVLPLAVRMVDALEAFIALDVPFLRAERSARIERLRRTLEASDVPVAEKFRVVLEAYQVENEYGRTIEAYRDTLELDGRSRDVEVLRIGRVALMYQTLDGSRRGYWDQQSRRWQPLDDPRFRVWMRRALQVARRQLAPELLWAPLPAPEAAG